MNHKLAKQLKDAGFPDSEDWATSDDGTGGYYSPSLEQLIEACGLGFMSLNHSTGGAATRKEGKMSWYAEGVAKDGTHHGTVYDFYPTPTEAVANLWIALNKKK